MSDIAPGTVIKDGHLHVWRGARFVHAKDECPRCNQDCDCGSAMLPHPHPAKDHDRLVMDALAQCKKGEGMSGRGHPDGDYEPCVSKRRNVDGSCHDCNHPAPDEFEAQGKQVECKGLPCDCRSHPGLGNLFAAQDDKGGGGKVQ